MAEEATLPGVVNDAATDAADDAATFWDRNPKGIPVQALFGAQSGMGPIGTRIKSGDLDADGYMSKDELREIVNSEVQATAALSSGVGSDDPATFWARNPRVRRCRLTSSGSPRIESARFSTC